MKSVPFREVLHGAAALLGLEPEDDGAGNFDRFQAAALTRHINRAFRRGWTRFPWPELERIEKRYFRPTWSEVTWAENSEVFWDERYWEAVAEATSDKVPGTAAEWEELTIFSRHIAYNQPGQTEIAEVLDVTEEDPTTYYLPARVLFTRSVNGVQLPANYHGNHVWVRFRRAPYAFTSTTWTAQNYAVGTLIYSATTGECYTANTAALAADVPGTSSKWTLVEFPARLQDYVTMAGYAGALLEDGQHERARAMEQTAEEYLLDAMQNVVVHEGQAGRYRVETEQPGGRLANAIPKGITWDSTASNFATV